VHAVVHLVEALHCKSDGVNGIFHLRNPFAAPLSPWGRYSL